MKPARKTPIREKRDSKGDQIAATVVIKDAALMSARGKKQIAAWLRRTATFLEKPRAAHAIFDLAMEAVTKYEKATKP